jgi:hypothetical protein
LKGDERVHLVGHVAGCPQVFGERPGDRADEHVVHGGAERTGGLLDPPQIQRLRPADVV